MVPVQGKIKTSTVPKLSGVWQMALPSGRLLQMPSMMLPSMRLRLIRVRRLKAASTVLQYHQTPGSNLLITAYPLFIAQLLTFRYSGPSQEPEPDVDWDPDTLMDEEARVQAEIERRRRAREAALKRGLDATSPAVRTLQAGDQASSTQPSTRHNTPGLQRPEGETPVSGRTTALTSYRLLEYIC